MILPLKNKHENFFALIVICLFLIISLGFSIFLSLPFWFTSVNSLNANKGSQDQLQGMWKFEQLFSYENSTGQLVPIEISDKNLYYEFKGNKVCISGQINSSNQPESCSQYYPFTVNGDTITIDEIPATFKWSMKDGKLELSQEWISKSVFVKYKVSQRTPAVKQSKRSSFNSKRTPLEGLWKIEQSLHGFDEATGEFTEENSSGFDFFEFKGNRYCAIQFNEKGQPVCLYTIQLFTLDGDKITITAPELPDYSQKGKWKIKNRKLELSLTVYSQSEPQERSKRIFSKWPYISKAKLKKLNGVWQIDPSLSTQESDLKGSIASDHSIAILGYFICPFGTIHGFTFECESGWTNYSLLGERIRQAEKLLEWWNTEGLIFKDGQLQYVVSLNGRQAAKYIFIKTSLKPSVPQTNSG